MSAALLVAEQRAEYQNQSHEGRNMKQVASFALRLDNGNGRQSKASQNQLPVQVLIDGTNTIVVIDCQCCKELLASRLPGGVLIPIASALKDFFEDHGMRNVGVKASGPLMRRTYKGVIDGSILDDMKRLLENAVSEFSSKRKSS
ncbi:MAG: hypothetical protein C4K47_04690 [Candidatus Thorarchaeota archaeon]|nr:MAG: hypothetical protein C4K47_04690 [Candidatus Thorarchaeota archaeon]